MRINAHTHIFNLKSVFTEETLDILLRRVTDIQMPEFVKMEIKALLVDAISKAGDYAEIEALVEKFVKEVAVGEKLKEFGDNQKVKFELIGGDLIEKAGVELLSNLLKRVTRIVDASKNDARQQHTFVDLLSFLIIGLKPSIAAVTSHIMKQLSEQDIIVALTMDITKGGDKDKELFNQQIRNTAEQVLRYPGRILPFIAVNPLRNGHRAIMERALTANGFVGVKLYPSLGHPVKSDAMHAVYRYCHSRDIPILTHCTDGGFYAHDDFRKNCEPKLWKPILKKYKGLKVCFGHFGDSVNLCEARIPPESWTQQILDLMATPENTGVYADISFHSDPMQGGDKEENYFNNLKAMLNDPVIGSRLMFGTDFWLVRMILAETNHWHYFESTLKDKDLFTKIVTTNPKRFLGIGDAPGQSNENIRNYVQFIIDHQNGLNPAAAARWAVDEINAGGGIDIDWARLKPTALWSSNNEAHVRMFWYLRDNQMYADDAESVDFFKCAHFSVTDLQYWNREFESASIFYRKCEAVAKGMDRYFRTNDAEYEPQIKRDAAIKQLVNALADEGTVLYDLGILCDNLYQFVTENN